MSAYTEIPKIIAETGELPPKVLGDLNSRYPSATEQSVEYFVAPQPLGNDENDGSQDYPLATLAATLTLIPDTIRRGHTITITLAPGEWNEDYTIEDRTIHGQLIIQGSSDDETRHRIRRFECNNVTGKLLVHNVESTQKNRAAFVFNQSGPHMELVNVRNIDAPENRATTGNHGVLADYGSHVIVRESHFENKRYALRANYMSRLVGRDNTGHDNTNGVGARFGGILSIQGTFPKGNDNNTTASSGGILVNSTGAEIGHDRYPEKGHLEQLALVGYDKMQADPMRVVTKRWSIRTGTQTGGAKTIPGGSALRLHFDKNTNVNVSYLIKAEFVYHAGSGTYWAVGHAAPVVTDTSIPNIGSGFRDVASNFGSGWSVPQMISLGHEGHSGRFYIDFAPNPSTTADAGWYGINIEMSSMRTRDAAIYVDAEVVEQ